MTDKPDGKRWRWVGAVAIALLGLAAAYEATHYATAGYVFVMTGTGKNRVCAIYDAHTIGGDPIPECFEPVFWPAEWIDGHFRSGRRPWNQRRGE
jgi:hypothetical protein